MKSKHIPRRDHKTWLRAKAAAIEAMRPGTMAHRQVADHLKAIGFDDLYIPTLPTLSRWASDSGVTLMREKSWRDAQRAEAARLSDMGLTAAAVRGRLLKSYQRVPSVRVIQQWKERRRETDPWKVAALMIQTRNGVDRYDTLASVHERFNRYGYGHLCARITIDSGYDLWEAGKFLEDHGCDQVAIDTALLSVFTNSKRKFLAVARQCMKKRKRAEKAEVYPEMDMAA